MLGPEYATDDQSYTGCKLRVSLSLPQIEVSNPQDSTGVDNGKPF